MFYIFVDVNRIIILLRKKIKVRIYQGLHLIATDKNSCQAANLQLLKSPNARVLKNSDPYSNIPNVQVHKKHS